MEAEFQKIGLRRFRRFAAIEAMPPAMGCALSHKTALSGFRGTALPMICEDDAEFLADRPALDSAIDDFMASDADVLLLAFNADRVMPYSETLRRLGGSFTAACYLPKAHMLPHLIAAAESSAALYSVGEPNSVAAYDVRWLPLQREFAFVAPPRRYARQRLSFSDIEGQVRFLGV